MINVINCVIILDSEKCDNNKKNDKKSLKLLVDLEGNLISTPYLFDVDIKECARKKLEEIIKCNRIHLEQVYALADQKYLYDKSLDVIYVSIMNINDIKKIKIGYQLVEFEIINDKKIKFNGEIYKYITKRNTNNKGSEYIHKVDVSDIVIEKKLVEILIAYKHLRSRIDNTNLIFKLLPVNFTLEDARIVYELIKDVTVDKSNFRKKIQKYLIKNDDIVHNKGFRPATTYSYDNSKESIWL